MNQQMQIKQLGYGKRCHACKNVSYITAFQLWNGDNLLKNIQLCPDCMKEDVSANVPEIKEENPIEKREARRRIKKSRALEQRLAKRMGGRAQPGSGNSQSRGFKGDIRKIGSWRVEHKFTEAVNSWTLKLTDLAKIYSIAADANEYPALVIEYTKAREAFAIIPLTLFLEMADEADHDRGPAERRRRNS